MLGRCFIIEVKGQAVGQINYNEVDQESKSVELDIWLSGSEQTGKGYGSAALQALCGYLKRKFGCKQFFIAPSRRNIRAVKAYEKAGFTKTTKAPHYFVPDYDDAVLMVKYL